MTTSSEAGSELPGWAQPSMRYRPAHGDVVAEEQARPDPQSDRRSLRLFGAARSVMFAAFAPLALMLFGRAMAGAVLAWGAALFRGGLLVAIAFAVCGAVLNARYKRLRKRTGYPVPLRLAQTVVAAHEAYTVLTDSLASGAPSELNRWTQWRAGQEYRRAWSDLLQNLDLAERAGRRGNSAAWARRVARVERDATQLLTAAQGFGGSTPGDD